MQAVSGDWEHVLRLAESKVGKHNSEAWLRPVRPLGLRDGGFHLEVPTPFFKDWILGNFADPIREAMTETFGQPTNLVFHVQEKQQGDLFEAPQPPLPTAQPSGRKKTGLVQNFTFSAFVVGGCNQFAHAAATAVGKRPGDGYNPLFVYGGVGLGKTHLINAIGHAALGRDGRERVMYLSSEAFTNELVVHIQRNRMTEFKNKFRRADVLIVDDVQFLSGRERTQEEFFHTFNSLHGSNKQIVLSSDTAPEHIAGLEERLRNRFESGLIADIQPPDLETRCAILKKKARAKRLDLPDEVALFIASKVTSNVRQLEGALTRLAALAALHQKTDITIDFARQVLKNLSVKPKNVSVVHIQQTVADHFGVSVKDLTSKRRTRRVTFPRQLGMYLSRKLSCASYPAIGTHFGGRDHTTALHACKSIAKRLESDAELSDLVRKLESLIDA